SRLDSKDLIQLRPPHIKRLVSFSNTPPPKLDLSPINLVLISTLDGNLHGVDRYTGKVLWCLEGATGGSLIRTFTRPSTKQPNSTKNTDRNGDAIIDIEVGNGALNNNDDQGNNHQESDDSRLTKLKDDTNEEDDDSDNDSDKITYIVEPNNDGILYMFSPKTGLQKFPYTVKQLVMSSPFRSTDGKVFIVGSKSTKFFAIDPATGKMLQTFSNEDDNECPSVGALPRDALYIGMNAYKISIFDEHGVPKWNLTYTEYVPNSFDANIEAKHKTSPDGLYIASTHSGEVLSTDSTSGQHAWYQTFSSPAVGIFDVLASKDLPSGLHIVRQPKPSATYYEHIKKLNSPSHLSAYIGDVDGTLFAMSVENYPLTQFMAYRIPGGKVEDRESPEDEERCHPGSKNFPSCLVGNHIMVPSEQHRPGIEGPSNRINDEKIKVFEPERRRTVTQVGMSWVAVILFFGIFYWSRKEGNNIKPWIERSIVNFMKSRLPEFQQFNSFDDGLKDTLVTKGAAKKDVHKKKKKNGKSTTAATKKTDVKDEEKVEKVRFQVPPKVQLPLSKSSVQVDEDLTVTPNNKTQSVNVISTAEINSIVSSATTTSNGELKLNSLVVTDTILGYGSHGTIVYKGSFEGRDVAVKRLLLDFYEIAHHEVSLLQESDDHPNVIRYYCKEQCDRFLYIALELCPASLYDLIERGSTFQHANLLSSLHPSKILYQIISGLHHLHLMKIVHRDIKPQNILLAPSKHHKFTKKDGVLHEIKSVRVLISDFGLCKKLEGESSSFHNTTNNAGGTIGWRAPELLSPLLPPTPDGVNNNTEEVWTSVDRLNDNSFTSSSSTSSEHDGDQPRRVTKAIDIFSAGCLFYYVLSGGDHPFGDRYSREVNILKGVYDLNKLDGIGEDGVEARDLIERMIERDPKKRPRAETVMIHPYFWSPSKRLGFLQDASDRFEIEERNPPSPLLQRLEQNAIQIIGTDWYKQIDKVLVENLGRYRKYDGSRIRDLLRALRNKKHHYQDLPDHVKKSLGEVPEGFLFYFTSRFSKLMLHVYYVIAESESIRNENMFKHYFEIPGLD
ncbi:18120_t:CDS:2, partial [Acaulospora morrowiae]